jgi:hypothetical protein
MNEYYKITLFTYTTGGSYVAHMADPKIGFCILPSFHIFLAHVCMSIKLKKDLTAIVNALFR